MSAHRRALERLDAEAPHRVDEALVLVALVDIIVDQPLDHVGHLGAANDGPITLPSPRPRASLPSSARPDAADGDLVPLLAVLVDAENADVADVMMAAGIHAAGNVEIELADVVQVVEVVEAALDRLGDRDRLGVGQRAEIAARAADDVGQQADVRRGEAERLLRVATGRTGRFAARRRRSGSARARRAVRQSCSARPDRRRHPSGRPWHRPAARRSSSATA